MIAGTDAPEGDTPSIAFKSADALEPEIAVLDATPNMDFKLSLVNGPGGGCNFPRGSAFHLANPLFPVFPLNPTPWESGPLASRQVPCFERPVEPDRPVDPARDVERDGVLFDDGATFVADVGTF